MLTAPCMNLLVGFFKNREIVTLEEDRLGNVCNWHIAFPFCKTRFIGFQWLICWPKSAFWVMQQLQQLQICFKHKRKRASCCCRSSLSVKRTSTDKPMGRTYGARPGSELHRLIFEQILLKELIKCNAYELNTL